MMLQKSIVCRLPLVQLNATTKTFTTIVLSQIIQPARSKLIFVWLYLGRPMLKRFEPIDIIVHEHTCFMRAQGVCVVHDMIFNILLHMKKVNFPICIDFSLKNNLGQTLRVLLS
jgi:hypothetical protein